MNDFTGFFIFIFFKFIIVIMEVSESNRISTISGAFAEFCAGNFVF